MGAQALILPHRLRSFNGKRSFSDKLRRKLDHGPERRLMSDLPVKLPGMLLELDPPKT
jgi:hypothetical protein